MITVVVHSMKLLKQIAARFQYNVRAMKKRVCCGLPHMLFHTLRHRLIAITGWNIHCAALRVLVVHHWVYLVPLEFTHHLDCRCYQK
ncbi:hypothetical protein GDO81_011507 [Engystomops pustulosus]|uniref:Uncharacterized protein n=1 Tax=Engystomops pustulosus TaxID=76066 RepID=A0AAV7BEW2_ENGPU|nr:hypothetical protein GDO81_011507 [Engystomops pustulosus]